MPNTIMKINKNFTVTELEGNYILVPYGKGKEKLDGIVMMNEVGVFIWNRMLEGAEPDGILTAIINEYDVAEEQARSDMEEFFQLLKSNEIIG